MLAKHGHRRLLGGPSLELGLDLLTIRDVREDAVPAQLTARAANDHRVVADPHDAAVAMDHAVLERGAVAFFRGQSGFARQHPFAVVGMQSHRP